MGDSFETVRLAAVQAASRFLDREASVEKACRLIREAGENGANLVAFPEGFIPGHPLWFHFHPAASGYGLKLSTELFRNAVEIPSPATDALCQAAQEANVIAVVGICEKERSSMGSMFNSQLFIGADGEILGVRRKLVPTLDERVVHTGGAGDSVRVFGSGFGSISGLICGENSNPLLTFAMQALGSRVHVASWPNFFRSVDIERIADVACRSIAYQNACYVVSAIGVVDHDMIEWLRPPSKEDQAFLEHVAHRGGSAIYSPRGEVIAGPLGPGEGIVYADAELDKIITRKIIQDYAGDYNRFDIFQLWINTAPAPPAVQTSSTLIGVDDTLLPRLPQRPDATLLIGGLETPPEFEGRTSSEDDGREDLT